MIKYFFIREINFKKFRASIRIYFGSWKNFELEEKRMAQRERVELRNISESALTLELRKNSRSVKSERERKGEEVET